MGAVSTGRYYQTSGKMKLQRSMIGQPTLFEDLASSIDAFVDVANTDFGLQILSFREDEYVGNYLM